ncbi:MAG: hypothetical protein OEZ24_03005, partial [Candidatus Bathyarchaeota archaeon]|nr:hypothetical protein [Candidatus Bathyarchaeota archaeon]
TLREAEASRREITIAAPVKPSDILLGEYLGVAPLSAIGFSIMAGLFTAALNPLGLDLAQTSIIVMIFIVTCLSALWIGTVVAAILGTKLGKSARLKDIGTGLSVILALPLVALMYATIGGGLVEALANPNTNSLIRAILGFLPSSWGSEVIIGFARNPGNISAVALETLTRVGGLVAFFVATLWLGAKAASRAYSLEPTTFTAPMVKQDGAFYQTIRHIGGGGPYGILLASTFKDYGRRLENISWLVYMLCLVAFVIYFNVGGESGMLEWPGGPLKILSLLAIPMLSGFAVGTVSRGKEKILIYRKSPSGTNKFIVTRLLQGCLIMVPFAATMMAVPTILVPHSTITHVIANTVWGSLRAVATVAFVLGLAFLIPTFSEESRARAIGIMINLQVVFFATMGLEIGTSELGLRPSRILPNLNDFTGLLCDHLVLTAIFLSLGIMLLILGRAKLNRIE